MQIYKKFLIDCLFLRNFSTHLSPNEFQYTI